MEYEEWDDMPRPLRTPHSEATGIAATLNSLYAGWFPDGPEDEFITDHFEAMCRDGTISGDAWSKQLLETAENVPDSGKERIPGLVYIALISCAYCAEAIQAMDKGEKDEAWTFVADASYWLGQLTAIQASRESGAGASYAARQNAKKRHIETQMLKNEVIEYWKSYIDSSLSAESAAEELKKQFPLKFRTLRDYVLEAKKDLKKPR